MPLDMAQLSTLIGSNYPCLELIFMVPKVFEPLKFDCISVILGRWECEKQRLCAMESRLRLKRSPPHAGLEPGTHALRNNVL